MCELRDFRTLTLLTLNGILIWSLGINTVVRIRFVSKRISLDTLRRIRQRLTIMICLRNKHIMYIIKIIHIHIYIYTHTVRLTLQVRARNCVTKIWAKLYIEDRYNRAVTVEIIDLLYRFIYGKKMALVSGYNTHSAPTVVLEMPLDFNFSEKGFNVFVSLSFSGFKRKKSVILIFCYDLRDPTTTTIVHVTMDTVTTTVALDRQTI